MGMTLKDKFRQELTGHLSDEKTEVDVNIAERIAENFAVRFAEWYADKIIDDVSLYYAYSAREFLQEFKKEKGL